MAGHVHDPHIPCPKCGHQIPLTESIAAPLLEAERRDFQQKLASREVEFARKADELRRQKDEVTKARWIEAERRDAEWIASMQESDEQLELPF